MDAANSCPTMWKALPRLWPAKVKSSHERPFFLLLLLPHSVRHVFLIKSFFPNNFSFVPNPMRLCPTNWGFLPKTRGSTAPKYQVINPAFQRFLFLVFILLDILYAGLIANVRAPSSSNNLFFMASKAMWCLLTI